MRVVVFGGLRRFFLRYPIQRGRSFYASLFSFGVLQSGFRSVIRSESGSVVDARGFKLGEISDWFGETLSCLGP